LLVTINNNEIGLLSFMIIFIELLALS
jgi:hypothetical protein